MSLVLPPSKPAHPWRKTVRTVIQGFLAFAAMSPVIYSVASNGADPGEATGMIAGILGVMAVVTRLFNTPMVEEFLRRYIPIIAAGDIQRDEAHAVIRDKVEEIIGGVDEDIPMDGDATQVFKPQNYKPKRAFEP